MIEQKWSPHKPYNRDVWLVLSGDQLFHKLLRAIMPVPMLSNKCIAK